MVTTLGMGMTNDGVSLEAKRCTTIESDEAAHHKQN